MKRVVLFGGGKIANKIRKKGYISIVAVIDNNKNGYFYGEIPFITLDEYKNRYSDYEIIIATSRYTGEIERQLRENDISKYSLSAELFRDTNVNTDPDISHENWPQYLKKLCDYPGNKILEVGSRVQTGANWREIFENATYTGFDYYDGENVDVVGDAHRLSDYFDTKFDLIFSSAVFEHLAMPWMVSIEIIKMLKLGGYAFVETHYSYSSHERPWHFFQFSDNALNVLFPEKMGMKCIKKGCCNLIKGSVFSEDSAEYLQGERVTALYCHSEYLGRKEIEVDQSLLDWSRIALEDVVGATKYPFH